MSVTAAAGFRAAGVAAGLRTDGALDVALVVNDGPSYAAAGVLTRNRVVAAPVTWTRSVLRQASLRAVVLNSGGANACTGWQGLVDAERTAERAARQLGVATDAVAVCSTGLIGVHLPMDRLLPGVDEAVQRLTTNGGIDAAAAIRTTDTVSKVARVDGDGFTVGGMAKGAGMLAPGLATMLAVITTDAVVDATGLGSLLATATEQTFERVDSDGCLSTNDTVLLLSSGASGRKPAPTELSEAVTAVCADLARQLVADAEGASKEVAVVVLHAATESDAVEVGRAVARNNLVKCALAGEDANWGRILAAVGTTAAAFDPERLDVAVNGVGVCRDSAPAAARELVDLTGRQVRLEVDLKAGGAQATVWTSDLTTAYVHENSAYST